MHVLEKRSLAEWEKWIAAQGYTICGTLNFARKPSIEAAHKACRLFWNKIDRQTYGRNPNLGVERAVCFHLGSNGDNPHFHFLACPPFDPQAFCVLANALWSDLDPDTAAPAFNEMAPVINLDQAARYLLHEGWKLGSDTLTFDLTHSNPVWDQPIVPRPDAQARLQTAVSGIWLNRAQAEYPKHVRAVRERYERRHT
jgi:hypothetical protein